MKNKKKIIIPVIVLVLIFGIIFASFYFNKNVKPNEMNNSTSSAPLFDKTTIEATVLNLSNEMIVVNKAGTSGTLHGGFAKVRIDRIINHTRYDPKDELGFNLLIIGDEIDVSYNFASLSIGDRIFGTVERGIDQGVWIATEYNIL